MAGKIFVISAPSGTGKTTLVSELLKQWNNTHKLKRGITYTTRSKRSGEQDGIEYYFITRAQFEEKIKEDFFLEWSEYCDHLYGSAKSLLCEVFYNDISFILILDQNGARALHKIPSIVLIWIIPPNLQELSARLEKREKNLKEDKEKRLKKAEEEIRSEKMEHLYMFHIINDDFFKTVNMLKVLLEEQIKDKVDTFINCK